MDKIFKFFTLNSEKTSTCISWFVESFPSSEFSGIELILYFFLEYCSKLGVEAKSSYLLVFLSTDLRRIVREYNIRIDTLTSSFNYDEIAAFEQAVQVISTATVDKFDSLCSVPVTEDDNFKVLVVQWMQSQVKDRMMMTFNSRFTEMSQNDNAFKVAEDTDFEINEIVNTYNIEEKIEELEFNLGADALIRRDDTARLITTTGIPAIDEDYGGIYSKALITMAGPTGGGKTRFLVANVVYRALVVDKVGVRMDELELSDYEVRNMLVSIHIANLYQYKIPDKAINSDSLTKEQREIVESARIDLFESGKYGRFTLVTKDLIVETMERKMTSYLKVNRDIQIWCVDYTGIISSKPQTKFDRELNETDIIAKALRIGKKIAKNLDIASVFVNQFNKEGNQASNQGIPITTGMIHGGQSVQRWSDYDLAITCTEDQMAANLRMLSTTKKRSAIGFNNVPLQTDLAILKFNQIEKIESRG